MKTLIIFILAAGGLALGGEIRSHRGNPGSWNEHCLGSYQIICNYSPGVSTTELDIHLSSDGVPVVIHDATLDRTTNASAIFGGSSITVVGKTLAQLKTLTLNEFASPAAQTIPTLEEALEFLKPYRMRVMLEAKVAGAQQAIAGIVAKVGYPLDRVRFLTDNTVATLAQYRATSLRGCEFWLISNGNPTSLGSTVLANARAAGWDGVSWQAFTPVSTDYSLMEAAGLLNGFDERSVAVASFAAHFDDGNILALTDDATGRVAGLDDTAWSNWAFLNGADTAIANRTDDPDGDGLTNFEELLFGTDPIVPGLVPAPYGYAVRYSGTGTERRAYLTCKTKPGEVSWEFWWMRAEESTDGTTWTAVPSNRVTETNTLWPADPTWRIEVDLTSLPTTRVRLTPQLFPRT